MTDMVICRKCGNEVHSKSKIEKNYRLQLLAIPLFLIGCSLLILPPFGTAIGALLMLLAIKLGHATITIWKCHHCNSVLERPHISELTGEI